MKDPKPVFKGVWIPKSLWLNENLTRMEGILLAEIDSLSDDGAGCYATNEFLGRRFACQPKRIANALCDLKNRGWLTIWKDDDGERRIRINFLGNPPGRRSLQPPPNVPAKREEAVPAKREPLVPQNGKSDPPLILNKREQGENTPLPPEGVKSVCDVSGMAERVYEAYPRKVAKPDALKAILRAFKKRVPEELLALTENYAVVVNGSDRQFVPHPSTWFNQERFNDDPSEWAIRGHHLVLPIEPSYGLTEEEETRRQLNEAIQRGTFWTSSVSDQERFKKQANRDGTIIPPRPQPTNHTRV